MGSNHDWVSQSHQCYHYTIGQGRKRGQRGRIGPFVKREIVRFSSGASPTASEKAQRDCGEPAQRPRGGLGNDRKRNAVDRGEIELDGYRFLTSSGRTQLVFCQVWDAFKAEVWQSGDDANWSRWALVKNRRRSADIYQLILVFEGEMGDAQAVSQADRLFRATLRPVVAK